MDWEACRQDPYGVFMPGYHWYTSWGTSDANLQPMKKMGQKMIFTPWAPENDVRSFGVIMADRDARQPGVNATTSHQDKEGTQSVWGYQGGGNPWLAQGLGPAVGPATGNIYVAWRLGVSRGKVDEHFVMDDGSVLRLVDVPELLRLGDDSRLTFIPDVMDTTYTTDRRAVLPRPD